MNEINHKDGLLAIVTLALAAWSYVAAIWIVQILAARHGFKWNAWHIAGYTVAWQLCRRPMSAELAFARIAAMWKLAQPDADKFGHIFPLYCGHAVLITIAYVVVRSL